MFHTPLDDGYATAVLVVVPSQQGGQLSGDDISPVMDSLRAFDADGRVLATAG